MKNNYDNIEEIKKEYEIVAQKKRDLSKIIRKYNDFQYQKKDETKVFCECCNKNVNKYNLDKHNKNKKHNILMNKLN